MTDKSCILSLLCLYPGVCTWSPRLPTGKHSSMTKTRICNVSDLITASPSYPHSLIVWNLQHPLMVNQVWVWNHSLSQNILLVAGYGFKFMACIILNANHFHHADDIDHSLNAMARLCSVSNNILTIYVKIHFKWYKICYMQRPWDEAWSWTVIVTPNFHMILWEIFYGKSVWLSVSGKSFPINGKLIFH